LDKLVWTEWVGITAARNVPGFERKFENPAGLRIFDPFVAHHSGVKRGS
jgi:hypothetical protein